LNKNVKPRKGRKAQRLSKLIIIMSEKC